MKWCHDGHEEVSRRKHVLSNGDSERIRALQKKTDVYLPIHIVDGSESDHMFRSEILVTIKFCDIKLTPPNSTKKNKKIRLQCTTQAVTHRSWKRKISHERCKAGSSFFFYPKGMCPPGVHHLICIRMCASYLTWTSGLSWWDLVVVRNTKSWPSSSSIVPIVERFVESLKMSPVGDHTSPVSLQNHTSIDWYENLPQASKSKTSIVRRYGDQSKTTMTY